MKNIIKLISIFILVISMGFPAISKSFDETLKLAKSGNTDAQYNLGIMYFYGYGTLSNKQKSAYWIKKAYGNGISDAKENWDRNELWKYE